MAQNAKYGYFRCEVENCDAQAKWLKEENIVEMYGPAHNHSHQVASNQYKVHCLKLRLIEMAKDDQNDGLTAAELYKTVLKEFAAISLPVQFKKKMNKMICNTRNRRSGGGKNVSSDQRTVSFLFFEHSRIHNLT